MNHEDNIKTIRSIYEAFGRGDVPALLEALTDDVEWTAEAASTEVPWWGPRHGKAEVGTFFEQFGTAMEVEEFTPLVIAADGDSVLTVVRFRTRSRANGRVASMELHHWFRFRDGKVVAYRGAEDTLQTRDVFVG